MRTERDFDRTADCLFHLPFEIFATMRNDARRLAIEDVKFSGAGIEEMNRGSRDDRREALERAIKELERVERQEGTAVLDAYLEDLSFVLPPLPSHWSPRAIAHLAEKHGVSKLVVEAAIAEVMTIKFDP